MISKINSKTFVGKGILHSDVWAKNDNRTIYNMIYRDGKNGPSYMKRFPVTGITRDKEYDLTNGNKGSEVLYFSANPNGEAEVIQVLLKPHQRLKKLKFDIDFSELAVKGRNSKGNLVTKYPIKKVELKEEGVSTLAPRKIWFDDTVKRLNADNRGELLGAFKGSDKILTINDKGEAKLTTFDLSNRYDEELLAIEKWNPEKPISVIYYDAEKERYFVKRFLLEDTLNPQPFFFLEDSNSFVELVTTQKKPIVDLIFSKVKGVEREPETVDLEEFIAVKGIKAQGNQLTLHKVKQINLHPAPEEEEEEIIPFQDNVSDSEDAEQATLF